MAFTPFLAMTAAEMGNYSDISEHIAWMACHFSPYRLGLSNLPNTLKEGSLLIVDDITPPCGHDQILIAQQLSQTVTRFQCCGVLLDFQRKDWAESFRLAEYLSHTLPCPTIVSEHYASELDCSVLLSPPPPSVLLKDYVQPWSEREIWLEIGLEAECLTLTETGCHVAAAPRPLCTEPIFSDGNLHCHYSVHTDKKSASFTLWRTWDDWIALLSEAETLGISSAIGLYQELWELFPIK